MASKESFRAVVKALVDAYVPHEREFSNRKEYNEFSLRREFLDKFFGALGWDIDNDPPKPPHLREVRFERPNEKRKRPDYLFLLPSGTKMVPQFIVEAKAPSESLDSPTTINQAKRYAWNTPDAPTPIAILTNFSEFKVYDGSIRPDPLHPERGLLKPQNTDSGTIRCQEYESQIDFLWNFSKEAVQRGSLESLLPKGVKQRQYRVPVDESFLQDMTEWREDLAKDLHRRNALVSVETLNEVVQRTLDRLVFIRMAEDRGILPDEGLLKIVQTWRLQHPYRPFQNHLNSLYSRIHLDLNGEIFEEHACERQDYWFTPSLLAGIIERMYFPKSPYLFDVIGIELLGSIYERFLGKTIRLTAKQVRVEDKPEVRKSGGVYYTPRPIVDYIVESAVGAQIRSKTPDEMARFRVVDPACGSGSFLVAAFSRLIDEHVAYYAAHPGTARRGTLFPDLIPEGDGGRLSIEKKADILRNSIFGVDIDAQAVEVTMMSLYLKALEGEQALPENKALLPRLKENIRCGNSLVSRTNLQVSLEGELIGRPLNPFSWDDEVDGFGEVLRSGKFNAVIGNPPYIRIQQLQEFSPAEAAYVVKNYKSAKGNVDLYIPFLEKATQIVSTDGAVGHIVSHKFFKSKYGANLREIITTGRLLSEVVDFRSCQVFKVRGKGPTTYTCLLFLTPRGSDSIRYSVVARLSNLDRQLALIRAGGEMPSDSNVSLGIIPQLPPGTAAWNIALSSAERDVLLRLRQKWPSLFEVAERIFQGNKTGADDIYILDVIESKEKVTKVRSVSTGETFTLETGILKPIVKSENLHRYDLMPPTMVLLFPYTIEGDGGELMGANFISESFPRAWEYLNANRAKLSGRKGPKTWWAYSAPKSLGRFERKKILTPDLAPFASFSFDEGGLWHFPGGVAGGYGILPPKGMDPYYLLGLLNSRLLNRLLKSVSTTMRGDWYSFEHKFIKQLPIRTVDLDNPADRRLHDDVASRSKRLSDLYPRLHRLPPSAEKDRIEREVRALEREIDDQVDTLYGLTPEEKAALG